VDASKWCEKSRRKKYYKKQLPAELPLFHRST
jgi:hypothetical protein